MTATSQQQPRDTASSYAVLRFTVLQLLSRMNTAMAVRVMAVTNDGDVAAVGTVDVNPLVDQISGDGQTVPHATIFKVPYSRMQGGTNAVILDPQVGDIGVCVFASRDISSVKADPVAAAARVPPGAAPASARTYDYADGIYLGGILNGVPTQLVQFLSDDAGIRVLSPTKVTLEAPLVEIIGDVTVTGTVVAQGDVTGDGVSLHDHVHGGVTTGGGSTAPPT